MLIMLHCVALHAPTLGRTQFRPFVDSAEADAHEQLLHARAARQWQELALSPNLLRYDVLVDAEDSIGERHRRVMQRFYQMQDDPRLYRQALRGDLHSYAPAY